jgi:hypothetical protein
MREAHLGLASAGAHALQQLAAASRSFGMKVSDTICARALAWGAVTVTCGAGGPGLAVSCAGKAAEKQVLAGRRSGVEPARRGLSGSFFGRRALISW